MSKNNQSTLAAKKPCPETHQSITVSNIEKMKVGRVSFGTFCVFGRPVWLTDRQTDDRDTAAERSSWWRALDPSGWRSDGGSPASAEGGGDVSLATQAQLLLFAVLRFQERRQFKWKLTQSSFLGNTVCKRFWHVWWLLPSFINISKRNVWKNLGMTYEKQATTKSLNW